MSFSSTLNPKIGYFRSEEGFSKEFTCSSLLFEASRIDMATLTDLSIMSNANGEI